MSSTYERTLGTVLAIAAVGVCAVAIHREFARPPQPPVPSTKPHYVKNWRDVFGAGTWIGDSTAPVVVVEFADYECPFCGRFNRSTHALRQTLGDSAAVYYIDFPLQQHRFAMPAAHAADCAAAFGAYQRFHDDLFDKQDSLGLKSWASYAADAGVHDTLAFAKCVQQTGSSPRIDEAIKVGQRFKVQGTPSVMINGWWYDIPPYDSLIEDVRHIAATPVPKR